MRSWTNKRSGPPIYLLRSLMILLAFALSLTSLLWLAVAQGQTGYPGAVGLGSDLQDDASGLAVDGAGNGYGTDDFDPGQDSFNPRDASAQTIIVNKLDQIASTIDVPDGDVDALIAAIHAANESPAEVNLAASGHYTLTAVDNTDLGGNGLPVITGTLTINGNGATIARSAAAETPDFRILRARSGSNLTLRDLTLTNGAVTSGAIDDQFGGALNSFGALTLERTRVVSNTAGVGGGGILLGDGPVVIADSLVAGNSTAGGDNGGGGGLQVQAGTVVLIGVTIENNSAADGGGLVTAVGDEPLHLAIYHSTIVKNIATGSANPLEGTGGGIRLAQAIGGSTVDTIVVVNDTLIANNQAVNGGGIGMGLLQPGHLIQLTLNRSAVVNNQAQGQATQQGNGGGILNLNAVLYLMDSTISGNTATGNPQAQFSGVGGGIANGRTGLPTTITMTNTSIVNNTALAGGGILNALAAGNTGPVVNFANSLIAGNTALGGAAFGPSCLNQGGTLVSLGHNLDQNNNCGFTTAGDQTNTDPLIGALADNGGPTPTHALLEDSPAIDTGSNAFCTFTDQRDVARPQGLRCDIGAYEAPFAESGPYDVPDGDVRALIGAIRAASQTGTPDPARGVTAPAVVNLAADGNYTLTSVDNTFLGANGLPVITGTVIINGNGATIARSSAEGTPGFRLLHARRTANLTVSDLTLTNGIADSDEFGGGIRSFGTLTLERTRVISNTAGVGGGGIFLGDGPVVITDTLVAGNSAGSVGGGLQVQAGTVELISVTVENNRAVDGGGLVTIGGEEPLTLTINQSTIVSNTATGDVSNPLLGVGGGVQLFTQGDAVVEVNDTLIAHNTAINGGGIGMGVLQPTTAYNLQLTLNRSAVVNNQARWPSELFESGAQQGNGGGILNLNAILHLVNSTISGNTATGDPNTPVFFPSGFGGGIASGSTGLPTTIIMTNTSVVDNTAGDGAGIYNTLLNGSNAPTIRFANSLIAGNIGTDSVVVGPSCWNSGGILESLGHNLDQDFHCQFTAAGDQTGVDPLLGPLANNGGPTPTHALMDNSPAIDAADSATCPATDQRGVARPQSLACDIGAYEATDVQFRIYLPTTQK